MKNVISVENMRKSDKYTIENLISSKDLMYSAALGIFKSFKWYGQILIVCGTGNNAGDGYALATILKTKGYSPTILLTNDKFSEDGLYFFNNAKKLDVPYEKYNDDFRYDDYDVIVDCIFGTGFKGSPDDKIAKLIQKINEANAYVISADINSGLNGNNGLGDIVVKSDLTVSIGYLKYGHYLNKALDYVNNLVNVDIGIKQLESDGLLLEEKDVKDFFDERLHFSNKSTYGYVGIMGGSSLYPGAIRLANLGQQALYAGAGVSRIIVPKSITNSIYPNVLESTVYPYECDRDFVYNEDELKKAISSLKALAIGVGIGKSEEIKKILTYLIKNFEGSLIIDADGLNNLSEMPLEELNYSKANIILTPHLKEFARLSKCEVKDVLENPVGMVKDFINKYNVTVLLKGPTTIVMNKNNFYLTDMGTPGMATAGSGDVLTGIITGILGYKTENIALSVCIAAYINGYAGILAKEEYSDISMVASDTARCVSKVIAKIVK